MFNMICNLINNYMGLGSMSHMQVSTTTSGQTITYKSVW